MKASLRVQPGIQEELTEVSISTICLSEGVEQAFDVLDRMKANHRRQSKSVEGGTRCES